MYIYILQEEFERKLKASLEEETLKHRRQNQINHVNADKIFQTRRSPPTKTNRFINQVLPIPRLLSSPPKANLRIIPNSHRFPSANSIPRNIIQLSCLRLQPAPPSRRLPSRNGKRGGNTRRDASARTKRG